MATKIKIKFNGQKMKVKAKKKMKLKGKDSKKLMGYLEQESGGMIKRMDRALKECESRLSLVMEKEKRLDSLLTRLREVQQKRIKEVSHALDKSKKLKNK